MLKRNKKGQFVKIKKIKRKCKICGKIFFVRPSKIKQSKCIFCSKKCYSLSLVKGKNKKCEQCGKSFWVCPYQTKITRGKFCSTKCFGLSERTKIVKKCSQCGKFFKVFPSSIKMGRKKFCSRKCLAKFKSTKTGKGVGGWIDGRTPKNKLVRESAKMDLWRKSVFTRDNYTCQKCKQKSGKLQSHHIFNFAQWINFRFELFNGIILCEKCHIKFHKIYGKTNNNREQLNKFLT